MNPPTDEQSRCGYAAIIGRPNVGKSTLLNRIIGQKISITAHKPQTTRHQILGIHNVAEGQVIFIDTPGIHLEARKAINRYMNRAALAVLQDVDIVLWLLEADRITEEDEHIGEQLRDLQVPLLIVVNKVDTLADKSRLLPFADRLNKRWKPGAILMLSARSGKGVPELERELVERLPFSRPFYDSDQITDRSERFLAAEFVREQLMRRLHQELPYATTVEIESFKRDKGLVRIGAVIWVERDGQKAIVIGKQGATLKGIGRAARISLEKLFGERVFLETWVKVKQGWSDDDRALQSFGYGD